VFYEAFCSAIYANARLIAGLLLKDQHV